MTRSEEWSSYVSGLLSSDAKLRACLARFTRNRADTDELIQETYARLLSIDVEAAREIRSVTGFALVVARRIALDWLKHQKTLHIESLPDSDMLVLLGDSTFTEDIVNCHQEIEQLIVKMSRLPPRCRRVFTLRKIFGCTHKEIGGLLDVTVHTVEQHMLKATRSLRASSGAQQSLSLALPLRRRTHRTPRAAAPAQPTLQVSRQSVSS